MSQRTATLRITTRTDPMNSTIESITFKVRPHDHSCAERLSERLIGRLRALHPQDDGRASLVRR